MVPGDSFHLYIASIVMTVCRVVFYCQSFPVFLFVDSFNVLRFSRMFIWYLVNIFIHIYVFQIKGNQAR